MEMTPKNNYDPTSNNSIIPAIEEADLQEMEAVDHQLDQLSSALDVFEQRTDDIIEQLKELLYSNREIRQQLAAVDKDTDESSTGDDDDVSDTNSDTDKEMPEA